MNRKLLAVCGTYCAMCPHFKEESTPYCTGCGNQKGDPYWGECKIYKCAADRALDHCGLCRDFPCDLFVDQFDPEQGQESALHRAGLLAYRKRAGTEKYLEMVKKLEE